MKVLRMIAAGAMLCLLAACASAQPTASTAELQQKVLVAQIGYEAPLSLAIAYNKRPRCTVPKTVVLCSEQSVVDELRKAIAAVMACFDTAMKLASTPGVSESKVIGAIAVATESVSLVSSIVNIYK